MTFDLDKGYLFLHAPKTGGTSIYKNLVHGGATHVYMHCWARKAKAEMTEFDRLFKFSFVRNPFARVASWYKWCRNEEAFKGTMREFVEFDRQLTVMSLFDSQVDFLSIGGEIVMDFVGKYESLASDWALVARKFDLPESLAHHKSSGMGDHRKWYDDHTREVVEERTRRDLEFFGYEF